MSVFSETTHSEELLQQEDNRLTIFPIKYPKVWEMYNKAVSTFWVPEEIDLSKDIDDLNALNDNEQYFIKHILAFFSSSDTIVNMNIGERLLMRLKLWKQNFLWVSRSY